jgi:hypothetical protein
MRLVRPLKSPPSTPLVFVDQGNPNIILKLIVNTLFSAVAKTTKTPPNQRLSFAVEFDNNQGMDALLELFTIVSEVGQIPAVVQSNKESDILICLVLNKLTFAILGLLHGVKPQESKYRPVLSYGQALRKMQKLPTWEVDYAKNCEIMWGGIIDADKYAK